MGGPHVRSGASDHELDACETAAASCSRVEAFVLDALRARGAEGFTGDEIAAHFEEADIAGVWPSTATKRLYDLAKTGQVVLTGGSRTTRRNCSAAIYVAREFAPEEVIP